MERTELNLSKKARKMAWEIQHAAIKIIKMDDEISAIRGLLCCLETEDICKEDKKRCIKAIIDSCESIEGLL